MSKTIKQWLETLPEPYRTEALRNLDQSSYNVKTESLLKAIEKGLSWFFTSQGYDYWRDLHFRISNGIFYIKQLQDRITLIEAKHGVTLNAPRETQKEYQQLKKELETKIHRL